MKEPKPLLREGASDFERQLLSAVMRERPSPQVRSRMRYALGLTGPIAWAGSVKAMLSALLAKGALGVAVVGLMAAGVVGVRSMQAEHDADRGPALERPSAVREVAVLPAALPPAALSPAALPPPAVTTPAAAPTGEKQASLDQTVGNRELREEILLLDQVRAALQRGSGSTALEQLDVYRQRFPSGILSREAAQLRQQAGTATRMHARTPRAPTSQH